MSRKVAINMFKKDFPLPEGAEGGATVIAEGVKVEGNFVSKGNVLVEGVLKGTVKTDQDLRVSERAKIIANVVAANAVISGEVQGNLKVLGQLEMLPTARVIGDVEAKVLIVSAGACLNGKCIMGEAALSAESIKKNGNGKEKIE